jgi:DNA-binding transcriptional ArsR family regulator
MIAPSSAVTRVFHPLGDPTRRSIVERLSKRGPLSASALAEPMGITLTAVTHHLRVLEECRLVCTEKLGRVRSCRVEPAGFAVLAGWIESQRSTWERRLDRLGDRLAEESGE